MIDNSLNIVCEMLSSATLDMLERVFLGMIKVAMTSDCELPLAKYEEIAQLTSKPDTLRYRSNCPKSVSDMMIPDEKTSDATTLPLGWGAWAYASIISLLVAWKQTAPPFVPAAEVSLVEQRLTFQIDHGADTYISAVAIVNIPLRSLVLGRVKM